MALWVFQICFDLVMVGWLVAWLMSRKESRRQTSRLSLTAGASLRESSVDPQTKKTTVSTTLDNAPAVIVQNEKHLPQLIETPLGSTVSTVSERKSPERTASASPAATSPYDAYEKADYLLTRGLSLREVARQTGLSLAELQLIGKMSQKNQ